jgi:hypothetical protein
MTSLMPISKILATRNAKSTPVTLACRLGLTGRQLHFQKWGFYG